MIRMNFNKTQRRDAIRKPEKVRMTRGVILLCIAVVIIIGLLIVLLLRSTSNEQALGWIIQPGMRHVDGRMAAPSCLDMIPVAVKVWIPCSTLPLVMAIGEKSRS